MSFTPEFLDELRSRIGLVDTISRRVKLVRRGREYTGLCPFHNEKTPSFTVSDEKGFFHCFGCGAHGDVIGFVMRTENLSFPEAVESLAEQAGVPVPVASRAEREKAQQRHSHQSAMEAACGWFEAQLRTPVGREGLAYLKKRGLKDETIARFRLGYAPDNRRGLFQALKAKGVEEGQAIELGLLRQPEGGGEAYDYFRGRVIFPITDLRGRVIAFGGRTLGDGQPKYLNSPEGPLFSKGRVLYALAQAAKSARDKREAVVVEGYMDVIALHEAGIENVVAPLGTALTEAQIELLWKLGPEPILCFDGDNAGQRAMWRAADRVLPLLRPGHSLRFVTLPAGEDPDSLVRGRGAQAVDPLLQQARPLVDVLWNMETSAAPLDTPERRADLRRRVLERIRRIAERTVQEGYVEEMEARLGALFTRPKAGPAHAQRQPRGNTNPTQRRGPLQPRSDGRVEVLLYRAEAGFLAAILRAPEMLDAVAEDLAARSFAARDLDVVRQAVLAAPPLDSNALQVHLNALGLTETVGRILGREVYEAAPFAHPGKTIEDRKGEWLAAWAWYWRREFCREIEGDVGALGADLSPERWARVAAKKQHLGAVDTATEPDDGQLQRDEFRLSGAAPGS